MNPALHSYFSDATQWPDEIRALRSIVLECGLDEEYKWKQPCYSFQGKNVVMIAQFKNYCTLSFFKGALLSDSEKWLVAPGPNSHHVRMLRFTDVETIQNNRAAIKAYIFEALEIEKAGEQVASTAKDSMEFPEELREKMDSDPYFAQAFGALTPGRQRGYILYFSGAKQAHTRRERIERYTDKILQGKGFHDCTCGLSKRFPTCDGSHKQLAD